MTDALEVITRGYDSSGRPVKGTRQAFQFYDRLNAGPARGLLVIVQGSFSNAEASAGTHTLAMCMDFRSWNLPTDVRTATVHGGRDLGGTMWWRTPADGFDEHIHNNLIGDSPAHYLALAQVEDYRRGLNGLANHARDRDPYRPAVIGPYVYQEDDMTPDERAELFRIGKRLDAFTEAEVGRDKAEFDRDKERFTRLVSAMGGAVDQLTALINATKDEATKADLREMKRKIMRHLKDDPDVTGPDNPSDEAAMADA